MISVSKAQDLILAQVNKASLQTIPVKESLRHVLCQDIKSDRPQPPIDRCLMDGIAISTKVYQKGVRHFPRLGIIKPGQLAKSLKRVDCCWQVMTGAMLPSGCDAVIPIERIIWDGDLAQINDNAAVHQGDFIMRSGQELSKGKVVLQAGDLIQPPHLGVLTSFGYDKVKVSAPLKLAVISTGDEIVLKGKGVKPFQVRGSNIAVLESICASQRLSQVKTFHLLDNPILMKKSIQAWLKQFDVLVLSGGVSKGEFDFVPDVLASCGVKPLFHGVSQKPGKPMWVGCSASKKMVFALPGNPVSTLICCYRYVLPYLRACHGLPLIQDTLPLSGIVPPKGPLTHFIPVKVVYQESQRYALAVAYQGSGDFSALTKADGFIEYDPEKHYSQRPYFSWRV